MEGKGNSFYLNTLEMASDIICIQEHWLYEFQKQVLGHMLPNMDMHIRCSDTNEENDNFKLLRAPFFLHILQTHRIIIAGDFNGTLKPPRKYNKHDRLLQAFVQEMSLKQSNTDKSTFFHHSGLSCSQVDYILDNTTSSVISSYKTHDRCPSNSSSHVPVSAKIDVKAKVKQSPVKPNSARQFKLQWKDIDSESLIHS
ncbi:unnamed protein product [Mytilus coruscus]|uniref:Endonuclease/exonuclease/phosphatase domain-containing protein n=1 Tax=Mytilus coruscus TaxID=42192 RepID=A0A6J8DRM0_MYTCO|nr:unnamed protein product [Mytilus coruscus]